LHAVCSQGTTGVAIDRENGRLALGRDHWPPCTARASTSIDAKWNEEAYSRQSILPQRLETDAPQAARDGQETEGWMKV